MKKKISAVARILISSGLLALLFWKVKDDLGGVVSILASCDLRYILLGVLFLFINIIQLANRLQIIFLGENLHISFIKALQLTVTGYFFNNFMPTAVGGDIVKAYYAGRISGKKIQSYASVLMDRFIGLYTFLLVAALALIIDNGKFQIKMLRPLVYLLLLIGAAGLLIITNRAIAARIQRFFAGLKLFSIGEHLNEAYSIVHDYRNRKLVVFNAFIVSLISQSVYYGLIYMFFTALGSPVSVGLIFLVMPVVTFISMVPSLGGLGVRELAIVTFFAPVAGKETSFAVSMLILLGLLLVSFFGGIVYLYWSVKGVPVKNIPND